MALTFLHTYRYLLTGLLMAGGREQLIAVVGDVANGAGTNAGASACAGVAAVGDAANGAGGPPALAGIAGAAQTAAVRCPLQLPPCCPCR